MAANRHWDLSGWALWVAMLCLPHSVGAVDARATVAQSDDTKIDFGIFWPPRDPSVTLPAGIQPLLKGCVQLHLDRAAASNWTARLRVVLSRPSGEADRRFWNTRLAYPQYSWMSRVRVWDVDEKWLWPNLSYLLRLHGQEHEERYGGVDPAKGVDNDFAAVLIRKFDVAGQNESAVTKDAPLVGAEWYPVDATDVDKQSIAHIAQSDEFTLQLGRPEMNGQGRATIWLIYADFLGASVPKSWPATPEYAGGILACFEMRWDLKEKCGNESSLRQIVPTHSTGFDWAKWARQTRSLKDSKSTAKLSDLETSSSR